MNQTRRNRIREIQEKLTSLTEEVELLLEEEQGAYENMPDSIKESERGEKTMRAVDILENAKGEIEDSVSTLEDIFED